MNAKTQRVGVCNAAETLLVHADIAQRFLVAAITRLTTAGVTIHADEATRAIVDGQPSIDADMIVARHRGRLGDGIPLDGPGGARR